MEKHIRIGLYRIFRKLGVKRDEIYFDALLKKNIFFDDQEWTCFLFLIESHFDITLSKSDEEKMKTVGGTIQLIQNIKQGRVIQTRKIKPCYELV